MCKITKSTRTNIEFDFALLGSSLTHLLHIAPPLVLPELEKKHNRKDRSSTRVPDETSSILAARRLPSGAWQPTAGNQTPPLGKTRSSHLNAEMEQSKSLTAPSPTTKQSPDLVEERPTYLHRGPEQSGAGRRGADQSSADAKGEPARK